MFFFVTTIFQFFFYEMSKDSESNVAISADNDEQTFVPLVYDQRYQISTTEPWNFRRIGKSNFLKQKSSNNGYKRVPLGHSNRQLVHRLVALQFIHNDNPETNTVVNHVDGNKLNNSISNLEWTTQSRNCKLAKRRSSSRPDEYLKELPENVIEITDYTDLELDGYYYDIDDEPILKVQNSQRIKVINPSTNGEFLQINITDIHGKRYQRSYNKLIKTMKELIPT